jgi:4-hydroxybenzoate polyprenyltransferase
MSDMPQTAARGAGVLAAVLRSARPCQWTKNLIVFAPIIFSGLLWRYDLLLVSVGAFAVLCALSGCAYILNDLADVVEDQRHPAKRDRPIPSGRLRMRHALVACAFMLVPSLVLADAIGLRFFSFALAYVVAECAYAFALKNVVIVDVCVIALAYELRLLAGGAAVGTEVSPWMLICTGLLALLLALGKRRHELAAPDVPSEGRRRALGEYSLSLLDQMMTVMAVTALLAYVLFAVSAEAAAQYGSRRLVYTVPFVFFGLLRYLYLVHRRGSGGDEDVLVCDGPLVLTVVLWAAMSAMIIYV